MMMILPAASLCLRPFKTVMRYTCLHLHGFRDMDLTIAGAQMSNFYMCLLFKFANVSIVYRDQVLRGMNK